MSLLVAVKGWTPDGWMDRFIRASHGTIDVIDARKDFDRAAVRYAAVWKPDPGLLAGLPNLEAIFNLGAGVDSLLADTTLPQVPVVRVVDADLTRRMTEYVVMQALWYHRRMDVYRAAQARREWFGRYQPVASEVTVGILGFGTLGRDAAEVLIRLGFRVAGWSRSGARMPGVESFAGAAGLKPFLAATDILVVLLPLTPDTRGILDLELLRGLKQGGPLGGPALINAGRGGLQVEADIIAALDEGTLIGATLDVFDKEPLPADNPLWSHPKVVVTPHFAADSDPEPLCRYVMRQIERHRAGGRLTNVVDRVKGY